MAVTSSKDEPYHVERNSAGLWQVRDHTKEQFGGADIIMTAEPGETKEELKMRFRVSLIPQLAEMPEVLDKWGQRV